MSSAPSTLLQPLPSRLEVWAAHSDPPPPVVTRIDRLPLDQLRWDDFERLCLRLARTRDDVEECRLYGQPGDRQQGIDLYAKLPRRQRYRVYQCKKVQSLSAAVLNEITDKFLEGSFAAVAEEFVLCTNLSLRSAALDDVWRTQTERFQAQGILAARWDLEEISSLLREHPRLVFDFFGPGWFQEFFGYPSQEFSKRLTPEQTAQFRARCRSFYRTRADRLDPGLPLGHREESKRLDLIERYVDPDVLVRINRTSSQIVDGDIRLTTDNSWQNTTQIVTERPPTTAREVIPSRTPPPTFTRLPAPTWIGSAPRQVLLGDPGIGKSTLLRFLASDLLADDPRWGKTARTWGERLPVWVPFPYWTAQISARHGDGVTLPELLCGWLAQEHRSDLWPLVEAALGDERLLLLVDGLDEYHDEAAAGIALHQLLSFLDAHPGPALLVSRPLGFAPLRGLLGGWSIAQVAPLSDAQQDRFAEVWFNADLVRHGGTAEEVETQTLRRREDFRSELASARELGELARVPLLLGLFIRLVLDGAHLPSSRREACERLATLLLEEHPRRRREASRLTGSSLNSAAQRSHLSVRDKRRAFAALALTAFEERPTGVLERAVVLRWLAEFLSADEGTICLDPSTAHVVAREFLAEAQTELGLLVESAPDQFGFFHRLIQEWLASERMRELPAARQRDVVRARAVHPQWREVLLSFLETVSGDLLGTILSDLENRWAEAPWHERDQLEMVLAAVAFGDTQINGERRRQLMARTFEVIERGDDIELRERLLKLALRALGGRSNLPRSTVRTRVSGWFPGRVTHREYILEAISNWPREAAAVKVLLANLHDERSENVRASAAALAKMAAGDPDIADRLCHMARHSASSLARAGALEALRKGWPIGGESRLLELARLNRDCGAPEPEIVAIRVLVAAGEQTPADRQHLLRAGRGFPGGRVEYAWRPDLVRALVAGWPEDPVLRSAAVRSLQCAEYAHGRLEQEVALHVLLGGFAQDERAHEAILKHVRGKQFSLHLAHLRGSGLLTEFAAQWRDKKVVVQALEEWIEANRITYGYGIFELYHLVKTEMMKVRLLERLSSHTTFHGLELQVLMSVWGPDDPAVLSASRVYVANAPQGYMHAQEHLRQLVADPDLARASLIAELEPSAGISVPQILRALRSLDGHLAHPEIIERCLRLRDAEGTFWDDFVAHDVVAYGGRDGRVRALASAAFDSREGNLNAVARGWGDDEELRAKLLHCSVSLPARLREAVANTLEHLPSDDAWADNTLAQYDLDAEIGPRCAAAAALARRLVRAGNLGEETLTGFSEKLFAEGPKRPERRVAGLCGLLAAGRYDRLLPLIEGELPYKSDLAESVWIMYHAQPLLRLIVQRWDEMLNTFGEVGSRLLFGVLDPHRGLRGQLEPLVVPGSSLARWLFNEQSDSGHGQAVPGRDLEALARAYPNSVDLRTACIAVLRGEVAYGPNLHRLTEEAAARLLANGFREEEPVLVELLAERPVESWGEGIVIALARGWPESAEIRRWFQHAEQTRKRVGWQAFWASTFALGHREWLIRSLRRLDRSSDFFQVNAFHEQSDVLVERVGRDPDLATALVDEAGTTRSSAMLLTSLVLLQGSFQSENIKHWIDLRSQELVHGSAPPPRFGWDYLSRQSRSEALVIASALAER